MFGPKMHSSTIHGKERLAQIVLGFMEWFAVRQVTGDTERPLRFNSVQADDANPSGGGEGDYQPHQPKDYLLPFSRDHPHFFPNGRRCESKLSAAGGLCITEVIVAKLVDFLQANTAFIFRQNPVLE